VPDGPGIDFWVGRDFPHPSRKNLGPTQPHVKWVHRLFPEVKPPGRGVDRPPTSNTKVKETVELYLYSPSWPSWHFLGWNVSLLFTFLLSKIPAICCVPSWNVAENSIWANLHCRSQWPWGLRRRCAAARLLRLCVRIPPGAWMSVCCNCCVFSSRGSCEELITRPEESNDCGVSLCVI
jgi:hypothetical protein